MKIILIQNFKSLGKAGDIKEVSEGYARNFLFPKKLAEIATPEAMAEIGERKAKEKVEEETRLRKLCELAERLNGQTIALKSKEKKGKLFGSITPKKIIEELEKKDLAVEEKSIIIKEAIKKTGRYDIRIILEKNIEAKIELIVTGE